MTKQIRLTDTFQAISQDELGTCMNSARQLPSGQVEVETFYRYGKPVSRFMEPELFYDLMESGQI